MMEWDLITPTEIKLNGELLAYQGRWSVGMVKGKGAKRPDMRVVWKVAAGLTPRMHGIVTDAILTTPNGADSTKLMETIRRRLLDEEQRGVGASREDEAESSSDKEGRA